MKARLARAWYTLTHPIKFYIVASIEIFKPMVVIAAVTIWLLALMFLLWNRYLPHY